MPLSIMMVPNDYVPNTKVPRDSESETPDLVAELDDNDAGDFIGTVIANTIASAPNPFCDNHGRRICPPCGHGCQRVIVSARPGAHQWSDLVGDLEPYTDVALYVTYDSYMFTWTDDEVDDEVALTLMENLLNHNTDDLLPIAQHYGWFPRFIPQWDEQVVGVRIWNRLEKVRGVDFKAPAPNPPAKVETVYCEECQLTWLKGETSKHIHHHPTHNTLRFHDASAKLLDERSLVVYVDAIKYGPTQDGEGMYGIGIYFGKDSKYNHCETMYLISSANRQNAEVHAACGALYILKKQVFPEYIARLKEHRKKLAEGPKSTSSVLDQFLTEDHKQAGKADPNEKQGRRKAKGNRKGAKYKKTGKRKGKAVKFEDSDTEVAEDDVEETADKIADVALEDAPETNEDVKEHPDVPKAYQVERPFDVDIGAAATRKRIRLGDDTSNDMRLIIATDSTNLVDLFCTHIENWDFDAETGTYHKQPKKQKDRGKQKGKAVENSDVILEVKNRVSQFESGELGLGVEVAWWRVPKKANAEALALAKKLEDY
ncbi:hypothetical protein F5B20DRAFT_582856 [Whalleya microplaca]|nr:hypothetical protein F5B20DRAFT_582856 [Whalleya microplaca]